MKGGLGWHAGVMQAVVTQNRDGMAPVDVVRAAFAAFNRHAMDEGTRYLAPDVEWHVPESALNPSVVHGVDELVELLEAEFEAFSEVRREPVELEERGRGRVVGKFSSRVRGRASGIELEYDAAYSFTVCAGRIARGEALN